MIIDLFLLRNVLHYDHDTGIFTYKIQRGQSKPGDRAGYVHKGVYRDIGFCGKSFKEHRLAWLYVYGVWPAGDIDHINGEPTDNRISNLRVTNDAKNCLNKNWQSSVNRSGFRGISYHNPKTGRPKWRVRITHGKKRLSVGNFYTLPEAIAARIEAENRYYGEYAPSKGCMKGTEKAVCHGTP